MLKRIIRFIRKMLETSIHKEENIPPASVMTLLRIGMHAKAKSLEISQMKRRIHIMSLIKMTELESRLVMS